MKRKINFGIIISLICAVSILLILFLQIGKDKGLINKGVYINDVYVGGKTKEEAKEILEARFSTIQNKKIELIYEDKHFFIDYKTLNAHYDINNAVDKAYSIGNEGNRLLRAIDRLKLVNKKTNIEMEFVSDTMLLDKLIIKISKKINIKPVDAKIRYTGGRFEISSHFNGISVNENKLKEMIVSAINPENKQEIINIPIEIAEPKIKDSMLRKIDTKLSGFSTAFKINDVNRTGNVTLASKAIDGTVVLPGEIFSMNKTLGPRIESRGYKEAPIIINGTITPGLAGGVCQVSSTLYNAVLYANFQIVERRPHGLRVSYVETGRDATISGDAIDFKFKNTNKYPIYIQSYVKGATLNINIYGANEHPDQSVEIVTEVYEIIKPEIEYVKDPNLEAGKKIIETKPIHGAKSRTYRKVYSNGRLIKTELISKDVYKAAKGKIIIGTKPTVVNIEEQKQTEPEN